MSQQWYFSKGGQQHDPVSPEQLKQLAASGQLQPTDLVWKEGMSQRFEARKVKGLFPIQTAVTPPSPQQPTTAPFHQSSQSLVLNIPTTNRRTGTTPEGSSSLVL